MVDSSIKLRVAPAVKVHAPCPAEMRWIIEDTDRNAFFRLGRAEANFLSALVDTAGNVDKANLLAAQRSGQAPFAPTPLQAICSWLLANKLATHEGAKTGEPTAAQTAPSTVSTLSSTAPAGLRTWLRSQCQWSSVFFLRIPLINPDAILDRLKHPASLLFCLPAELIKCIIVLIGFIAIATNWLEFQSDSTRLLTPQRGLSFAAAWLVLKLIHELSHAMVCKRYGGKVREAGAAFILLMPIAYVDVSSGWLFDSKWKRLHVTIAGVLSECFIGGLAIGVWIFADAPWLRMFCVDLVILATVGSLLFNANPLLKFDGYFALADITGVDNLYQTGQQYARFWGKHYLLGMQTTAPDIPTSHATWIRTYGLASAAFRCFTVSGLIIAAAYLLGGFGIFISAIGVVTFVLRPTAQLVASLAKARNDGEFSAAAASLRLSLFALAGVIVLTLIPLSGSRTAPGIVQFDPSQILRAPTDGFISDVCVKDGQIVEVGQVLLVMKNENLSRDVSSLRVKLARSQQAIRAARLTKDPHLLGKSLSECHSLETQLAELEYKYSNLTIRAPEDGMIVARRLADLSGRYCTMGDELLMIGDAARKRVCVSLSASQARTFDSWQDKKLRLDVPGIDLVHAAVTRTDSRASTLPVDPSITALHGGPLAAIRGEDVDLQLCAPCVRVYITLDDQQSRSLHCGQRCFAHLPNDHISLLSSWVDRLSTYLPRFSAIHPPSRNSAAAL